VVPFVATVSDSLRISARDAGIDILELNNKASRKVALRNADRLIREKVDLVIEFQLFADLASILAAKYSLAHIPMIAVGVPHPGAVYFGPDNYKAGRIGGRCLADWVRQHWRGTIDELVLLGVGVAGPTHEARLNGIVDGLVEANPECRAASMYRYSVNGRFEQAQEIVRKHLRARRGGRIAVGAVNDMTALGALEAFRESGAEETCAVVGQDGVPEARAELRRPNSRLVGTVAYFPETYGPQLVRIAIELLEQRAVSPAFFTQHRLLTPANVDKLYPNDGLLGDDNGTSGTRSAARAAK
jgi:ribose transport system substrate-binding protein